MSQHVISVREDFSEPLHGCSTSIKHCYFLMFRMPFHSSLTSSQIVLKMTNMMYLINSLEMPTMPYV